MRKIASENLNFLIDVHGNKQYQTKSGWAPDIQQSLEPSQWRILKKMVGGYLQGVPQHEHATGVAKNTFSGSKSE